MIVRNKVRPLCDVDRRVLRRVLNTSGQFAESFDDIAAALRLPKQTVKNSLSRLRARGILVRESRRDAAGHRLPAVWVFGSPEGVDEMVDGQLLTDLRRRIEEKPKSTPIVHSTHFTASGGVGLDLGKPKSTPIDITVYQSPDKENTQLANSSPQSTVHGDSSAVI